MLVKRSRHQSVEEMIEGIVPKLGDVIRCDGCGKDQASKTQWLKLDTSINSGTSMMVKTIQMDICPTCRQQEVSISRILDRLLEAEETTSCPIIDREKVCICDEEEEPKQYLNSDYRVPLPELPGPAVLTTTPFKAAVENLFDLLEEEVGNDNANVMLPEVDAFFQRVHPLFMNTERGVRAYASWRSFVSRFSYYFERRSGSGSRFWYGNDPFHPEAK